MTVSSWVYCRCRTLDGVVQQERADRWCIEVAKAGLQERVATQAAAEVQLEGRAERLRLQCTQQLHIIAVRMLHTWGCYRLGVASQMDQRIRLRSADLQRKMSCA